MPKLPDPANIQRLQPRETRDLGDPGIARPLVAGAGQIARAAGRGGDAFKIGQETALQLGEAQRRIVARDEAVNRLKSYSQFSTEVTDHLNAAVNTEDLSDNETVEGLRGWITGKKQELLDQYSGTPEGRQMLEMRLTEAEIGHKTELTKLSLTAKQQAANNAVGAMVRRSVADVTKNPGTMQIAIDNFRTMLRTEGGDAFTPDQLDTYEVGGVSSIVEASITSLIDRGFASEAQRIYNDTPGLASMITPEGQRTINNALRKARTTTGMGTDIFGKGTRGRTLGIFSTMSDAFAAGALSPMQDDVFVTAVTDYAQPRQVPDPDTGLPTMVRPVLPPQVQEAIKARPDVYDQLRRSGVIVEGDRPMAMAGEEIPALTPPPRNKSVAQLALEGLVTGPVAAVGELAGRTPGLGGMAPEMTQARSYVPLLQRDLTRVLQNNPRYAEGERQAIEREINISPRVFDNPQAFVDRLVGIDQALDIRYKNALKTAGSPKVSSIERRHAMNVANALENFRGNLLPPRFEKPDEGFENWRATAEPGSVFLVKTPAGWELKKLP